MATIYPSLIAGDLLNISQEIQKLEPYCQGFHLDLMDNNFVPNLGFSIDFINAIGKVTARQLWVHLMALKPEAIIDKLFLPGGSIVTFHFETTSQDQYLAKRLREKNLKASIAINPKTRPEEIFPFLHDIDQVLIMSVEPGHSGQDFLPSVVAKIEPLIGYRTSSGLPFRIAIDGGISTKNIAELAQKGIDDFGVASAIFKASDPIKALQELQKLIGE